jgi:hypothetical protein
MEEFAGRRGGIYDLVKYVAVLVYFLRTERTPSLSAPGIFNEVLLPHEEFCFSLSAEYFTGG